MRITLASEHPDLIQEWSQQNNISPDSVTSGSNIKVWWHGKCGHEWMASIKNRARGSGCPFCSSNKVLKGFNDLATVHPELAAEWSEKNYQLIPNMVTAKSNKEVIWRCKYGHEWKARVADRTEGHGCPECSRRCRIDIVLSEFFEDHPGLSKRWSDRNEVSINKASASERRMYWWKCKQCGQEFRASVGYIVKDGICSACIKSNAEVRYKELLINRQLHRSKRFRLAQMAFEYYASQNGLIFIKDDISQVGIPFQYYLPEYRAAVEFSEQYDYTKYHRMKNSIKNDLCLKSRIKMIRILESKTEPYRDCLCISRIDDSMEGITESLQMLLSLLDINADIDVERDINDIRVFHLNSSDVI